VEGQTRIIKLPEDDLQTVTDYLTFTYSHDLPTSKVIKGSPQATVDERESLAKLYVLGERALDKCIRNAVVSEIVRISATPDENGRSGFMHTAASNVIFDGTPDGSPIRKLIVDTYVSRGNESWLQSDADHHALILEFARALLEKVISRQPYEEFRVNNIKAEDYFV
jgi:hypothetical protein